MPRSSPPCSATRGCALHSQPSMVSGRAGCPQPCPAVREQPGYGPVVMEPALAAGSGRRLRHGCCVQLRLLPGHAVPGRRAACLRAAAQLGLARGAVHACCGAIFWATGLSGAAVQLAYIGTVLLSISMLTMVVAFILAGLVTGTPAHELPLWRSGRPADLRVHVQSGSTPQSGALTRRAPSTPATCTSPVTSALCCATGFGPRT